MPKSPFTDLYLRVVKLLESLHRPYIIVGGMATGVLGEPRLTFDVDVILDLRTSDVESALQKAREEGFLFDPQTVMEDINQKGTFRLQHQKSWVDLIVASTELERSAFRRAKRVKILGIEASFPSPEDFILFKLIPGRPKDLLDAEAVVLRQGNKLDQTYLLQWAQRISDEMQDLRVFNAAQRLLKRP